jgi:hypothetical protein
VKIIGDSLHSCELLREKIKTTLNQDAPVAIAKGMLLLKELMPSWMNYAQSLLQGRNSWKELKTRVTTDWYFFFSPLIMYLGII